MRQQIIGYIRLVCVLFAVGAVWAVEKNYWQALEKGELWEMSPGNVWRYYMQGDTLQGLSRGILITGKEGSPSADGVEGSNPLPRSFWFWTQSASDEEWLKAWKFDTSSTESLHYMQLAPHASERLQRVSSMLYCRAGSDEDTTRVPQLLSTYKEFVERLLGVSAEQQPEKTDAAGRSICTLVWQSKHTAAMLESATVNNVPDYVRLTFAPTLQKLYYERTASDHPITLKELKARVQGKGEFTTLGDFKNYSHYEGGKTKPYLPGWFAALCYYGLHDLDNYEEKRPKADYPGQYTERSLRNAKTGKKLHDAFEREYKRAESLQAMSLEDAKESFVLDHHKKNAYKLGSSFSSMLESGLPIICSGSSGYMLTAFANNERETTFLNHSGDIVGVEQSYLHPGAIFVIIPGSSKPGSNAK